MTRKYPFIFTLAAMTGVCIAVYAALFIKPEFVGVLVVIVGVTCAFSGLVQCIRRAFDFGSQYAAEFVAGQTKRHKLAENPLMRDPFYQSLAIQIEEAKAKHKPVRHLYAKRDTRVRELLGTKGMAQ